MAFFLRKIRKNKWCKSPDLAWLRDGELQADAMGDLRTSSNTLSLWKVKEDKSDLEDILTAIVSAQDRLSHIDYVLIRDNTLDELGIKTEYVPGRSHYPDMNKNHIELVELTGIQLYNLAKSMMAVKEKLRVTEKNMGELLAAAARTGSIKMTDLEQALANKISSKYS